MILAASDLDYVHALQRSFDLRWLQDPVAIRVAKTELALIRITAAKDLAPLSHKHRVTSASL